MRTPPVRLDSDAFDLARHAFARGKSRGDDLGAVEIARDYGWARAERIARAKVNVGDTVLRSAVAGATTIDPSYAGVLVDVRTTSDAFLASLAIQSPLDALAPMAAANLPPRTRMVVVTNAATGSIVAEGKPKPVTRMEFNVEDSDVHKASCIVVVSDELYRMSSTVAVPLLHGEVAKGCAAAANGGFVTFLIAGAAVTLASSGDFLADLNAALSAIAGGGTGRFAVLVSPAIAIDLATDPNPTYDTVTPTGGRIRGVPIFVSDQVPPNTVVVVDAAKLNIDPGVVMLDSSKAASLQMSDAPTGDIATGTSAATVSLFQTNSIALRAERYISYRLLYPDAVAVVTNANYAAALAS